MLGLLGFLIFSFVVCYPCFRILNVKRINGDTPLELPLLNNRRMSEISEITTELPEENRHHQLKLNWPIFRPLYHSSRVMNNPYSLI